ncbi:MAG: type II secretion system major pseudopilin GspG [Sedimentisphaerales bacterium]|nr:type II secretion system major pseudopilin GspG [Sedimentisphaerales bacterium]
MNRRTRKNRRKGFTLIELVIVAVILALLGTLVVPNIVKKFGKAKHNIAKAKMKLVEGALIEFQVDCGRFPSDTEGLGALVVMPDDLEGKWDGPYLKEKQLLDAWEQPFLYIAEGEINPGSFDLISYGADGAEGGEGENADIYNDE